VGHYEGLNPVDCWRFVAVTFTEPMQAVCFPDDVYPVFERAGCHVRSAIEPDAAAYDVAIRSLAAPPHVVTQDHLVLLAELMPRLCWISAAALTSSA
jgi:hypothetical protein